jgi:pyruvate-formate lyase
MTNHAGLGRLMKALPNGRKAGENLASGITPVSGVTPCLPAVLNSVARLPSGCLSNGVALNLKFVPIDGGKEEMVDNLASYVEAYFDERRGQNGGGMEIQFNIIDRRTFLDVVRRPKSQDYNELLVRVSGYTAYFRDLSPQMKKEIIDRTEYRLSTGKMTAYDPIPLPERM